MKNGIPYDSTRNTKKLDKFFNEDGEEIEESQHNGSRPNSATNKK